MVERSEAKAFENLDFQISKISIKENKNNEINWNNFEGKFKKFSLKLQPTIFFTWQVEIFEMTRYLIIFPLKKA